MLVLPGHVCISVIEKLRILAARICLTGLGFEAKILSFKTIFISGGCKWTTRKP